MFHEKLTNGSGWQRIERKKRIKSIFFPYFQQYEFKHLFPVEMKHHFKIPI